MTHTKAEYIGEAFDGDVIFNFNGDVFIIGPKAPFRKIKDGKIILIDLAKGEETEGQYDRQV